MPTPPMPGWNEPVAIGTRSPILSEAFCPSTARICGFWISLVLLSPNRAVAVADGIVTVKSVAFRFPSRFRLIWFAVPEVVELLVLVVVVVVLRLFCKATVALVGGLIPRFRVLSR